MILISLALELLQYCFYLGGSDITDVITNTLGGLAGILIFTVMRKFLKEKTVKTVCTIGITAEVLAGLIVIVLLIFVTHN